MAGEQSPAGFSLRSQLWFRGTGKYFETATSHMPTVGDNLMETKDILIIYLPSIIYFFFCILVNNRNKKVIVQLIILLIFLISVAAFGLINSKNYNEITPMGSALMVTSPLLLLGPILITIDSKIKKKNRARLTGIISTLIIPPIGVFISFFILILTGHINGL